MALPAPHPWFLHLTNPPGEYHHRPKELTANSADGDVRANRPGERRQGRLWTDVIHDELPDRGGMSTAEQKWALWRYLEQGLIPEGAIVTVQ